MLLFGGYALTAWYGTRQNGDTWAALLSAWHLGRFGSLDLSSYHGYIPWRVEVGDAVYTNRFPGVILAGTPFYALLGQDAQPTALPAAIAASFWTAAAMAVAYVVFSRMVRPRLALTATLVLALATPTWTVSADGLWTHGPAQLWLMLAVLALSARRPGLAGLAFGAAVLTRPHLAIAAAAAGGWYAWQTRSWSALLRCAAGALLGAAALLLYNHQLFGSWSLLGGYDSAMMQPGGVGPPLLVINVIGGLVSPHRGIFVLTPFLLLLVPGLRAAWSVAPAWVRAAALGGLAYGAVQLYLIRFIGGHGFYSYRTLIEPLTLAAPLLLLAYREWTSREPWRRAAFNALVVLAFFGHAFGAILDQHRQESGGPWANFGPWTVAQENGFVVAGCWLAVALVVAGAAAWWPLRGHVAGGSADNATDDSVVR